MPKNEKHSREDLAIDALMAATVRTGELDPEMTEEEAMQFAASHPAMTEEDHAAIDAMGPDLITLLRHRIKVETEPTKPLGRFDLFAEPTYATRLGAEKAPTAEPKDRLVQGRRLLDRFLGEDAG